MFFLAGLYIVPLLFKSDADLASSNLSKAADFFSDRPSNRLFLTSSPFFRAGRTWWLRWTSWSALPACSWSWPGSVCSILWLCCWLCSHWPWRHSPAPGYRSSTGRQDVTGECGRGHPSMPRVLTLLTPHAIHPLFSSACREWFPFLDAGVCHGQLSHFASTDDGACWRPCTNCSPRPSFIWGDPDFRWAMTHDPGADHFFCPVRHDMTCACVREQPSIATSADWRDVTSILFGIFYVYMVFISFLGTSDPHLGHHSLNPFGIHSPATRTIQIERQQDQPPIPNTPASLPGSFTGGGSHGCLRMVATPTLRHDLSYHCGRHHHPTAVVLVYFMSTLFLYFVRGFGYEHPIRTSHRYRLTSRPDSAPAPRSALTRLTAHPDTTTGRDASGGSSATAYDLGIILNIFGQHIGWHLGSFRAESVGSSSNVPGANGSSGTGVAGRDRPWSSPVTRLVPVSCGKQFTADRQHDMEYPEESEGVFTQVPDGDGQCSHPSVGHGHRLSCDHLGLQGEPSAGITGRQEAKQTPVLLHTDNGIWFGMGQSGPEASWAVRRNRRCHPGHTTSETAHRKSAAPEGSIERHRAGQGEGGLDAAITPHRHRWRSLSWRWSHSIWSRGGQQEITPENDTQDDWE